MNWRIVFATGLKGHIVSEEYFSDVCAELADRSGDVALFNKDAHRVALIDLPGMVMIDRRIREFVIDENFSVAIPSEDFEHFLDKFQNRMREREFDSGKKYFKIKGTYVCIVLNKEQLDKLISEMLLVKDDAIREGKEDQTSFFKPTIPVLS